MLSDKSTSKITAAKNAFWVYTSVATDIAQKYFEKESRRTEKTHAMPDEVILYTAKQIKNTVAAPKRHERTFALYAIFPKGSKTHAIFPVMEYTGYPDGCAMPSEAQTPANSPESSVVTVGDVVHK